MRISTFWAGWSGPKVWNFTEGPVTLGLLPAAYRHTRIAELKAGSDFARKLGVTQLATHAGFIPENPHDPEFAGMMDALREVAQHCRNNGQKFLFETGQETPVALLRARAAAAGVAAGTSCSLLLGIAVGFFGAVNTFIGVTVICVLRKLIIHIDRLTDGGATDIGKRDARR